MYSYNLRKAIDKYGFTPVPLTKNTKYEQGKTYWCGYWQESYSVDKIEVRDGIQHVLVTWEDGHKTAHCTSLDFRKDYELIME